MELKLALKVGEEDNVATIFASGLKAGEKVEIRDRQGKGETVSLLADVPYGHKIAVRDIGKGEAIRKYGEEIGVASADISKGGHVHVHNLDSRRGRGDLEKSNETDGI
jgi:altronate dehydratase small subunit